MEAKIDTKSISNAKKALWFLVPVASIGVAFSTFISPGIIGQGIFTLTKIWLVVFPWLWRLKIEKKTIRTPKVTWKQINWGLILGVVMSVAIVTSYFGIGQQFLDVAAVREQAIAAGITDVRLYFAGVMYWSFVNSFIEEVVWRGFVYRHCKTLFPRLSAILISALFFTLHHIIAMAFYLQDFGLVLLSSLGVFIAGTIWSACLQRSSFWSAYISHILADLAIGFVGWHLLFS